MGLVTLYLVRVLKESERVIARIKIYVDEDRQAERKEEHETNKDR